MLLLFRYFFSFPLSSYVSSADPHHTYLQSFVIFSLHCVARSFHLITALQPHRRTHIVIFIHFIFFFLTFLILLLQTRYIHITICNAMACRLLKEKKKEKSSDLSSSSPTFFSISFLLPNVWEDKLWCEFYTWFMIVGGKDKHVAYVTF